MSQEVKKRSDGWQKVTDDEILHVFDAGDRPFYSSQDVADELEMDRSSIHRRLESLADREEIKKVETGNGSVTWWRQRDTVVFVRDDDGPFTAIHTASDIASQGDTRPEALRMLAEAIELTEAAKTEEVSEAPVPDAPWFDE